MGQTPDKATLCFMLDTIDDDLVSQYLKKESFFGNSPFLLKRVLMSSNLEFQKGIKLCLENADLWFNESKLLYEQGSYGHSIALLIHGEEALVQALYCWYVSVGVHKPKDKIVLEVFKSHPVKLAMIHGSLVAMISAYVEDRKTFFEKIDWAFAIEEFPKKVMELRNRGIYVNYDSNEIKFTSPNTLTKEDVDALRKIIDIVEIVIKDILLKATDEQISVFKLITKQILNLFTEKGIKI